MDSAETRDENQQRAWLLIRSDVLNGRIKIPNDPVERVKWMASLGVDGPPPAATAPPPERATSAKWLRAPELDAAHWKQAALMGQQLVATLRDRLASVEAHNVELVAKYEALRMASVPAVPSYAIPLNALRHSR